MLVDILLCVWSGYVSTIKPETPYHNDLKLSTLIVCNAVVRKIRVSIRVGLSVGSRRQFACRDNSHSFLLHSYLLSISRTQYSVICMAVMLLLFQPASWR